MPARRPLAEDFAPRLLAWQARHGRHDLPWQGGDPYRVWLSEIMLQQTRVDTVIPYFRRFTMRFPDLASLAAAPLDDVLALWSGLGYYARARNLHTTARRIVDEHAGVFPRSAATLAELPGIGRSTAAAIAASCFGERVSILDGNVKRVFARHFGIEGFPGERRVEQQMWALAESLVPARGIERYPQALMDLGALLCTRSRPRCSECPVATSCVALRDGRTAELPAPRPRKAVPERVVRAIVLRAANRVLLQQRPPTGIWGGLFSLPELAADERVEAITLRLTGLAASASRELDEVQHAFTHFRLRLQPELVEIEDTCALHEGAHQWIALDALDVVGIPAPVRRLLGSLTSR